MSAISVSHATASADELQEKQMTTSHLDTRRAHLGKCPSDERDRGAGSRKCQSDGSTNSTASTLEHRLVALSRVQWKSM